MTPQTRAQITAHVLEFEDADDLRNHLLRVHGSTWPELSKADVGQRELDAEHVRKHLGIA